MLVRVGDAVNSTRMPPALSRSRAPTSESAENTTRRHLATSKRVNGADTKPDLRKRRPELFRSATERKSWSSSVEKRVNVNLIGAHERSWSKICKREGSNTPCLT